MRFSEPTRNIWIMTDAYCQQQKCRPMTCFCGIRFVRTFAEVPRGRWRQTTVELSRTAIFSVFTGFFSDTLELRPAFLCGDTQSVVGFSVIQNDLDSLFRVKFCFRAGLTGWDRATSESNCVKTNKNRHILSVVQIFGRDSSFWQYKVCADIR